MKTDSSQSKPAIPDRVLIVDADQALLMLIATYVSKAGSSNVKTFFDGTTAQTLAKSDAFDLIVLDWKLKNPNGKELYQWLRHKNPPSVKTPIVLISGFVTPDDLKTTTKDPLTTFLVKPFTQDVLLDYIKKIYRIAQQQSDLQIISTGGGAKTELFLQKGQGGPKGQGLIIQKNDSKNVEDLLDQADDLDRRFEIAPKKRPKPVPTAESIPIPDEYVTRAILSSETILGKKVDVLIPEKILIADGDPASRKLVESQLQDLGAFKSESVEDGKQAWDAIQSKSFDFVIMDWKLKGISGLCLYNRIRSFEPTQELPVIVLSGLVHKNDFRLLSESPFTNLVQKPLNTGKFETTIKQTLKDVIAYKMVVKFAHESLKDLVKSPAQAWNIIENHSKTFANPIIFLNVIGHNLSVSGDLELAEKTLKLALRIEPNNVTAMSELSKIFHRLGRTREAIALLAKANEFSPESVERLCSLGEMRLTLQETDRARSHFQEVLKIDDEHVKAGAGLVLTNNLADHLEKYNHSKPLSLQFAGVLNAVGITYVRAKKIPQAIEQYKAAMCFIYEPKTLAKLQFNLGMAHLRDKDYHEAYRWFSSAQHIAGDDFQKPGTYATKIGRALGLLADPGGKSKDYFKDHSKMMALISEQEEV